MYKITVDFDIDSFDTDASYWRIKKLHRWLQRNGGEPNREYIWLWETDQYKDKRRLNIFFEKPETAIWFSLAAL